MRIDDEIQNFHCPHIRRYRNRVSHTSHELYAEKPNYTDAFSSKYPFIAYNYTIFANQDSLNSYASTTPDVHIDNNLNFDINNSYSNTITDFIRRGSKVVDLQPAPNKWWLKTLFMGSFASHKQSRGFFPFLILLRYSIDGRCLYP